MLARAGCPVVIGVGNNENFVASDVAALLPVTRQFMFLDEGDVAEIRRQSVRILDSEGNTAQRPVRESALSADAAEKGDYAALHAQGDLRAAARDRADARRARRRRQVARSRVRPAGHRSVPSHRGRADRRVRHELSRRRRREVLHRADRAPAVLGRDRERVSLSQSGRAEEHAVRHDLAVGRDGRHARGAAHGEAVRLPVEPVDLQRAGELARARIGARAADARRPGDRRRVDQGVHDAARGARHARRRAGQVQRHRRGARARAGAATDRDSRADREDAASRRPRSASWRSASRTSITRCSSAAARCIRSRWKARSSSRRSRTSTPRRIRPAS